MMRRARQIVGMNRSPLIPSVPTAVSPSAAVRAVPAGDLSRQVKRALIRKEQKLRAAAQRQIVKRTRHQR